MPASKDEIEVDQTTETSPPIESIAPTLAPSSPSSHSVNHSKIKPALLASEVFVVLEAIKTWHFFSAFFTYGKPKGLVHTISHIRPFSAAGAVYIFADAIKSRTPLNMWRDYAALGLTLRALEPLREAKPAQRPAPAIPAASSAALVPTGAA